MSCRNARLSMVMIGCFDMILSAFILTLIPEKDDDKLVTNLFYMNQLPFLMAWVEF